MKTILRFAAFSAIAACVAAPSAFAQRQLGKKKGPTSKMYLAETKGDGEIVTEGKAYKAKQATAFDAPGTVIETKDDSHQAFVYSNGTGMYVDANTRVEVDRFVQEPFQPDRNSTQMEPSISQSDVFVAHGMVGICTSEMVSGSTMTYSTPHAAVNIRGHKVAIQTNPKATTIYLIEGDVTVRSGGKDIGGQMLRPGEQATITPGPPGQPPSIAIGPIDQSMMTSLDDKVNVACNAKKTVSFETIEKKSEAGAAGKEENNVAGGNSSNSNGESNASSSNGNGSGGDSDQEIVARPTVPETPNNNITVSPDRITTGT